MHHLLHKVQNASLLCQWLGFGEHSLTVPPIRTSKLKDICIPKIWNLCREISISEKQTIVHCGSIHMKQNNALTALVLKVHPLPYVNSAIYKFPLTSMFLNRRPKLNNPRSILLNLGVLCKNLKCISVKLHISCQKSISVLLPEPNRQYSREHVVVKRHRNRWSSCPAGWLIHTEWLIHAVDYCYSPAGAMPIRHNRTMPEDRTTYCGPNAVSADNQCATTARSIRDRFSWSDERMAKIYRSSRAAKYDLRTMR